MLAHKGFEREKSARLTATATPMIMSAPRRRPLTHGCHVRTSLSYRYLLPRSKNAYEERPFLVVSMILALSSNEPPDGHGILIALESEGWWSHIDLCGSINHNTSGAGVRRVPGTS